MHVDFSAVTETPGNSITREALSMLYTRYRFAASFCAGKDVLDVACGTGSGLGYLEKRSRRVVASDYTSNLVRTARGHYHGSLPLLQLDAQSLPFRPASFDVVLLYEAIYYLPRPERFVGECRRILREKGTLLICTINREWTDFNPSPLSTRYFSASELSAFLHSQGFLVDLAAAFPVTKRSLRHAVVSSLKRTAVSLNLIPKTMKGKALLKRVFLGPLSPVPAQIHDSMASYSPPVPIVPSQPCPGYKVLFAVARPS